MAIDNGILYAEISGVLIAIDVSSDLPEDVWELPLGQYTLASKPYVVSDGLFTSLINRKGELWGGVGPHLQTLYPDDFELQLRQTYSNIKQILISRDFKIKDVEENGILPIFATLIINSTFSPISNLSSPSP